MEDVFLFQVMTKEYNLISNYRFSGNPANQVRYRKTIVMSYGFPALVSICTLIAEYSSPRCSSFRPRFGEEGCFFAGIIN